MRFTNKFNVHDVIANTIMSLERPPSPAGRISVTEAIKPPQLFALERKHYDEIVQDVSEYSKSLMGIALHYFLEKRGNVENALQEETLGIVINGTRVTGRPDLWRDNVITDFKTTSVWAFVLGEKPEWEAQINSYAVLYRETGFPVHRGEILGLLYDWQKQRARDRGYPPCPFICVALKLWAPSVAHSILADRVEAHDKARRGSYPPCTNAERWARAGTWAVKKRGNIRALRGGIHLTEEAAQEFADQQSFPVEIEHRPGRNIRCEGRCRVAPFCSQWAKIQAN